MIVIKKKHTVMNHCLLRLAVCAATPPRIWGRVSLGQIAGHIAVSPSGIIRLPGTMMLVMSVCCRVNMKQGKKFGTEKIRRGIVLLARAVFQKESVANSQLLTAQLAMYIPLE